MVAYFSGHQISFTGEAKFINDTFSDRRVVFVPLTVGAVLMFLVSVSLCYFRQCMFSHLSTANTDQ